MQILFSAKSTPIIVSLFLVLGSISSSLAQNYPNPAQANFSEDNTQNYQIQIDTLSFSPEFYLTLTHYYSPQKYNRLVGINIFDVQTNTKPENFEKQKMKGRVYAHNRQKLGRQNALFLYHHQGDENILTHQLIYLIPQAGQVFSGSIEMLNEEKMIDFDQDGTPEILHTSHPYYPFSIENCAVADNSLQDLMTLSNYQARLLPEIYQLTENQFKLVKGKKYEQFLKRYLDFYEQDLIKLQTLEHHRLEIIHYVHYFYVCAKIKEQKRAWQFLAKHNQPFNYICLQNGEEKIIQSTVLAFIQQYQTNILRQALD